MAYRVRGLVWNDVSEDKLAAHGLSIVRAQEVLWGRPRFKTQEEGREIDEFGVRPRPKRLRMIGPDGSGRLLTIILELPDADGDAHVVTGWPAKPSERTRYRQLGGRR